MSTLKKPNRLDTIVICAIFAVLGAALLAIFVGVAEPGWRKPRAIFAGGGDAAPLLAALTTNGLQETLAAIEAATRGEDDPSTRV